VCTYEVREVNNDDQYVWRVCVREALVRMREGCVLPSERDETSSLIK